MIASHHGSDATNYRNVIRQTWGSIVEYKGISVHRIFMFGKCPSVEDCHVLHREVQDYGDILMGKSHNTII